MLERSNSRVSQPKFEDASDFGSVLLCPNCGNSCTHHTSATVFNRSEDAEIGRRTIVTATESTTDNDMTGNPSGRRDGLVINFYCETCPTIMELDVFQHKGQTFFRMRHKTDHENDPREICRLDQGIRIF